jgi:hypothetical protein
MPRTRKMLSRKWDISFQDIYAINLSTVLHFFISSESGKESFKISLAKRFPLNASFSRPKELYQFQLSQINVCH